MLTKLRDFYNFHSQRLKTSCSLFISKGLAICSFIPEFLAMTTSTHAKMRLKNNLQGS